AVHAAALAEGDQLRRRAPRMPPPAAAHGEAQLLLAPGQAALERAEHAGGDARGMPIHPQHATQRLEPERMRQPAQDSVRAFVQYERLDDDGAEPRHALRQPGRNAAAVEREIGAAGAGTHTAVPYAPPA